MANKKGVKWVTVALVGGITLVVSGVAWKLLSSKKTNNTKTSKAVNNPTKTNNSSSGGVIINDQNSSYPLKKGSKGSLVRSLQVALNSLGADPALTVDGIFGSKTEAELLNQTGSSSIQSSKDLQALIDKTNNIPTGAALLAPTCNYYNPINELYKSN